MKDLFHIPTVNLQLSHSHIRTTHALSVTGIGLLLDRDWNLKDSCSRKFGVTSWYSAQEEFHLFLVKHHYNQRHESIVSVQYIFLPFFLWLRYFIFSNTPKVHYRWNVLRIKEKTPHIGKKVQIFKPIILKLTFVK